MDDKVEAKAEAIKKKLHIGGKEKETFNVSNPLTDSYKILKEVVELLADCDNEAFSQLDKGAFKDIFVDETQIFAQATNFANNPFANLDKRLKDNGIFREVKTKTKHQIDGEEIEIEETTQEEIHHIVRPLQDYKTEWMRKRVPVNRMRVHELIQLAKAARGGDFLERQTVPQSSVPPMGGRLV